MTEPTRKPRAKTRVKNLGGIKASLIAVSMAFTVGGWAVLARDDSLVLGQTTPQAGIEQSAPPTISAPPPPTATQVPFQSNRRGERVGQSQSGVEGQTRHSVPNQVPTQPAPQPTPVPTQPAPTQPPTVAPQPRTQPSGPRISPPVQAPQPRARTRSSR